MALRFSIHDISVDDDTLSRKCTVRLGSSGDIKFQTPMKTGVDGVTELPVYEAYRKIKPLTIRKCLQSENYDRKVGLDIQKRCRGTFNILTMEYDSKEETPSEEMVVALSDIQYNHTDVITTPSWFELITEKNSVDTELYLRLTDIFVKAASTRNHKPIVGTIPQSIPPEKLKDVIKYYIENDITSFLIDSHNRILVGGMWVRTLHRSLEDYDIENECFLYSMNAFQGIAKKNEMMIEAKDFVGFADGMDVIGGKHTGKFFGRNYDDEDTGTIARKFDPITYNYEKMQCTFEEKEEINNESVRVQDNEFSNIREMINEGKIKDLLKEKKISKQTLNSILSSKTANSTTLDDFI